MIETKKQLELSCIVIETVENALESLRKKVKKKNPKLFDVMSEDYRNIINKTRKEIDTYLIKTFK